MIYRYTTNIHGLVDYTTIENPRKLPNLTFEKLGFKSVSMLKYISKYIHMYIYIYTCIHTYSCIYVLRIRNIYTHIYIHTYTYSLVYGDIFMSIFESPFIQVLPSHWWGCLVCACSKWWYLKNQWFKPLLPI